MPAVNITTTAAKAFEIPSGTWGYRMHNASDETIYTLDNAAVTVATGMPLAAGAERTVCFAERSRQPMSVQAIHAGSGNKSLRYEILTVQLQAASRTSPSGGAGSFGSLTGVPGDNTALAAALATKSPLVPVSTVIPVGTHCEHANDNAQSNGTDTTSTSRTRHFITCGCYDVQALLTNIYGSTSPTTNNFPITVKAAIEINSVIYPLFIRGARTATLAAGGVVYTDPFPWQFAAGDIVFLRINVSVSSGDKWPRWAFFSNSVDTFETGADRTDSGAFSGTNGYSYRASGLFGKPTTVNQGSVLIVGDSIAAGSGGSTWMNGFIQRSFGGDYGKEVPHVFIGASGETANNFTDQAKTIYRLGLARNCTAALVQLGTHDIFSGRTAAQVQANLQTIYARLRTLGINRIYQTTITPRTTSTDSWTTVNNQTTTNVTHEAERVTLNAWIRANTAGISGFFEVADVVESARDSGRWKAGATADGIHPTDAMHTTMAAAITTSGLLTVP